MDAQPVISIIAILVSPVIAVVVGQCLQNRKKNFEARRNLFLTLISYRMNQIHPQFVMALNQIDVVFHEHKEVLEAWRLHFENLEKPTTNEVETARKRTFLDLSRAMALDMGYTSLKQTDVDKFYSPQAHTNLMVWDFEIKDSLHKFLKNGDDVFQRIINEAENKKTKPETVEPSDVK